MFLQFVFISSLFVTIRCIMEGYIIGGEVARIVEYPYAAYLKMSCGTDGGSWFCGSSIINQDFILTAAHCLHPCTSGNFLRNIFISAGSAKRSNGLHKTRAESYIIHERYDPDYDGYDIGLVKLANRLKFSKKISRVAIMKSPPQSEVAQVSGWGFIDVRTYLIYAQLCREENQKRELVSESI